MSTAESKVYIIGVGNDGLSGLTGRARELVLGADIVLGSDHALDLLPEVPVARRRLASNLTELMHLIDQHAGRRLVLVVTGDPLFYGISRYLSDKLGKDRFEVLPHVSTMQLAFARVKESWEEAYLSNLATHPLEEVIDRIRTAETAGLFTTPEVDPARVARELLAAGIDYFRAYVCENLGSPDERVTQGELADVAAMEFAPLNVLILVRKPDRPDRQRGLSRLRRFGNPDDVFAQTRPRSNLLTQAEVRAIGLAQLDVRPGDIVWDIGAGSGSVSLEAAQLAAPGIVYAIEQDVANYHLIVVNAQTFGVTNVKPIHGTAPAVFTGLPAPDAVFVGGTGGEVARLLEAVYDALKPGGRMVVNVATLEAISAVSNVLKRLTKPVEVLLIQVSRGIDQMESLRFEAINPTFLLSVTKPLAQSAGFAPAL